MSQQPLLYLPRHPVGMKRHHHRHAKHRRQKGSPLSIAIIGVAIVIGSFGGVGSSPLPSSSSSPPIAEEDSRRPQGSVASQSYISAADVGDQQSSSPAGRTDPKRRFTASTDSRSSWSCRRCTQARADGAAPVYAGQPGYGPHLDRDGDGIGCEPYRGR